MQNIFINIILGWFLVKNNAQIAKNIIIDFAKALAKKTDNNFDDSAVEILDMILQKLIDEMKK